MKQTIAYAFLGLIFTAIPLAQAEILIKSGEKLAFLGDSITQYGKASPGGYVNLVSSGLATNGVKIEVIGAGISGHKSNQMLGRLENDVLRLKPQWMTLSCGVNDVWHGEKGVSLEDYKKNITSIVDKAQAEGIKVILLTSTMIGENQASSNNQKLVPYNDFLCSLAKEKKCLLADLNADMQAAVAKVNTPGENSLTSDGVHMAFPGDMMMATGVLKAIGLDEKEIANAQDAWMDLPDTNSVKLNATFSQREMQRLEKAAVARNTTVPQMVDEEVKKVLDTLKK